MSSLDTLHSLILNSHKLTEDPPEINNQLLYSPISNIYMSCELIGHPPEFNTQLP
jgi:hypothetical protein